MPEYNLIPERAFEDLPENPAEAFLRLLAIAESSLQDELSTNDADRTAVREAFSHQIVVIADELGLDRLNPPSGNYEAAFRDFENKVAALKTRLRIRLKRQGDPATVRLSKNTKSEIEERIERLKEMVDNSELPGRKKAVLNDKLDDMLNELKKKRLTLAEFLKISASIAAILGGSSAALANGPEASKTLLEIVSLVGSEKADEDAAVLQLPAPLKALPPPRNTEDGYHE